MKKTLMWLCAVIALVQFYFLARSARISADRENINEVHSWVWNGTDPARQQTVTVLLDYDFESVDRCILQATTVRRGKTNVLRIKCLKFP